MGERPLPDHNSNLHDPSPRRRRLGVIYGVLVAIFAGYLVYSMATTFTAKQVDTLATSDFVAAVRDERVTDVTYHASDGTLTGSYYRTDADRANHAATEFKSAYAGVDNLDELMQSHEGVRFVVDASDNSLWESVLLSVVPTLLLLAVFVYFMNQVQGQNGRAMQFGQTKAKTTEQTRPKVKFSDVAGIDEAVEELKEVRDFLREPERYLKMGAKIPRGVLLVGPPGTGKTLLAKAVAGEAGVPFFSISGSDFVEMFVGVGASRVRDLFQEASKVAPAIIFIDEIDAIGRSRDSRLGGNDEREQTLNQLLAEIDGFDSSKGVVILAATNRPEILDKALLRAGRFDRRIIVDRPNLEGRYQTLLVHTRNIRLAEDVDLKKIAQATAGAVGADLANLVNEAALRAVRMGRQTVNQEDLLTSFEVVIAGTEKKGTVLTDIEKRIVAYHEVGHALVAALQKHTQPVSKITIVPHTSGALGYTMQMPEEEKYLNSRDELLVELRTMLGGRAAEQTVFGIETTGASNDIERATDLARKMVMQYGMSDRIGLMALTTKGNEYLDGQSYTDCAQTTAAAADEEVRKLLNDSYDQAKKILAENRGLLDEVALYLLQKETITGDELMQYVDADKRLRGSKQETLPEAGA